MIQLTSHDRIHDRVDADLVKDNDPLGCEGRLQRKSDSELIRDNLRH